MNYSSFTSESVCSGHPDKICDQISDAIVDTALTNNPYSRVAVETLVSEDYVSIAGEVTTNKIIPYKKIAQKIITELGYIEPILHFNKESNIYVHIHEQSKEIAQGVETDGAGDQGMMFGYACTETPSYMPMPITIAHALAQSIDLMRKTKKLPYLRPDGKTQITVRYKNGKPVGVDQVVLAVPHKEDVSLKEVSSDLYKYVVCPVLDEFGFSISKKYCIVNGTGVWHIGGPASDTGVTGRKIIVDTYGGYARVGGGAFSGKDPTKVDRSGAYAARFLAKNVVAAGYANKAEVRIAYFIGAKKPSMLEIETFGTEKKSHSFIKSFMHTLLNPSVKNIIETLNLRKPIFKQTATYGHFGRNIFPWERIVVK